MNSGGNYSYGTKTFGKLADGEEATLYTISNTKGMYAQITDFGASIVSLVVKIRTEKYRCGPWL